MILDPDRAIGHPGSVEKLTEHLALDDAVVPVYAAGDDDKGGQPAVVAAGSDVGGLALVGAKIINAVGAGGGAS